MRNHSQMAKHFGRLCKMFLQGFIGRGWTKTEKEWTQVLGFMTVDLVYGLFVVSECLSLCVSDLELISHGPLLEFHTPESSHDPGLAAQASPRPQGPPTLFHMGYTHLAEKFIHTHSKHDT